MLNHAEYDLLALKQRLKQQWGIEPVSAQTDEIIVEGGETGDWFDQLLAEESVDVLTEPEIQDGNLVFDIPGAMVVIGYTPTPVPDGEAERFAASIICGKMQ